MNIKIRPPKSLARRRLGATLTALAMAVLTVLGTSCGGGPAHDKSAEYTPEAIAQELAFRFKSLPENARKVTSRPSRKAAPLSAADLKKSGEATKEALVETADALFDEIAGKVRALGGVKPAEAFKRAAEAVRKDDALSPAEKETLSRRLEELGREA